MIEIGKYYRFTQYDYDSNACKIVAKGIPFLSKDGEQFIAEHASHKVNFVAPEYANYDECWREITEEEFVKAVVFCKMDEIRKLREKRRTTT